MPGFKSKTGDTCVAIIVWPIIGVVACLLIGAVCGSCLSRRGMSEDSVRKAILQHKQREAAQRVNNNTGFDGMDARAPFVRNQHQPYQVVS